MQMPILTYPHFSQFLHLHQQQQQLQKQYSRGGGADHTAGSETSTGSPSPSPSPPLSTAEVKATPGKSFTIDAILGLREEGGQESLFHPAFHHRLQVPDLSRLSGVLGNGDHTSSYSATRPTDKSDGSKKCAGKSKRVRTIFTPEQLERLEAEFERQQYMVGPERLYLAHTLQLTEAQVKVWFQNRRIKWRKQHLELQQQRLAVLKRQRAEPDDSGDSDDSSGGKFGYPAKDATATLCPGSAPAPSYRYEDNQSSRESLNNPCDDEFI